MFKPISREQNKLRLALCGPAGSGKTYTALMFAGALAAADKAKIAVLDTESNSASLYVGERGWAWDGVNLTSFAPSTYTACLREAGRMGYGVVIVDSLSHAWSGTGGALDQVDRAAGKSGGRFSGWKDVTPQHNELIDALRRYPGHVIVTLRSKMEYALEEDEKGKKRVEKLGMKPIQREGVEYELDIVLDMDTDHRARVTKTRFSGIDGQIIHKPGPEWIAPILDWLRRGSPKEEGMQVSTKRETAEAAIIEEIKHYWRSLGWSREKLIEFLTRKGVKKLGELPRDVAIKLRDRLMTIEAHKQADGTF